MNNPGWRRQLACVAQMQAGSLHCEHLSSIMHNPSYAACVSESGFFCNGILDYDAANDRMSDRSSPLIRLHLQEPVDRRDWSKFSQCVADTLLRIVG